MNASSDLDREYSPSSCVPDVDALLRAYAESSRRARAKLPPRTLTYGPAPSQRVDLFRASPSPAPGHLFVHGGYWQELDKDDASFLAPGFVGRAISYLAAGYGLAPEFSVAAIVDQIRALLTWVTADADPLGLDPARVVLSGSSAGAHLAVMAALGVCSSPAATSAASTPITSVAPSAPVAPASEAASSDHVPAGLVLLSGIYDLRPLVRTYVNAPLGLDDDTAWQLSPLAHVPPAVTRPIPTVIAWGERETDAFKVQSSTFANRWTAAGNPVTQLEVAGRNHFDIVFDLADPDTELGALVAKLTPADPVA